MIRKRLSALALIAGLCLTLFGCQADGPGGNQEANNDPNTLTVTLVRDNGVILALEEQFPDLNFEVEHYKGANASGYLLKHLQNPDAMPDLYIGTFFPEPELQRQSLLDLSGYGFLNRFQTGFVNNSSIDGQVYLLPCCYQLHFYVYNKTLFEEHGWEKPANHRELVSLVEQIREEVPELIPISLPGRLPGYSFQYFNYFSQCDFLSTPDGVEWKKNFKAGKASAAEGLGEGAELLQELIDVGAYDPSLSDLSNAGCLEQFVRREAAMAYVCGGYRTLNSALETGSDEYGAFPFMGKTEDSKVVGVPIARYLGLGKQLGDKGNEKKLENALRVMDYLCTPEGLKLIDSTIANTLLPLKNSGEEELNPLYRDVYDDVQRGYIATPMYVGYTDIIVESGWAVRDALLGKIPMNDALKVFDERKALSIAQGGDIYVGEVKERLTNAEAAQFAANLYLDTGLGEIALVSGGPVAYSGYVGNPAGVCGVMYEGKIAEDEANINLPYNCKFATVKLTGQQIKTLLEDGITRTGEFGEQESFDYYWSGMDVAMEDGNVLSMKLDGQEVEMDQTYTVVMNEGSYSQEIAETAEVTVYEDFPDTTTYFKKWLAMDGNFLIEKPEILRK